MNFIATQNPIINNNKEYEFKSARIRGQLKYFNQNLKYFNPDKSNIFIILINLN